MLLKQVTGLKLHPGVPVRERFVHIATNDSRNKYILLTYRVWRLSTWNLLCSYFSFMFTCSVVVVECTNNLFANQPLGDLSWVLSATTGILVGAA